MLEVVVEGFCPYDVKEIYLSEGLNTHNYLRGDYFIKIYDRDKTIYITDFAGSYSAGRFPRNSTTVIKNNEIVSYKENVILSPLIYSPPTGVKRKISYDRLFEEIDSAVALRCQDSPVATMSSGHDSGTIVASALHQKLSFTTLSVSAHEYEDVLTKRRLLTNGMLVNEWDEGQDSHYVAAVNLSKIGCKSIISGLGADEVFTTDDYQLLSSFLKESQKYYHSFGIQTRYPLLDPEVYWQYHALSQDLIGKYNDKKPLVEYMKSRNFPYTTEKKVAFYLN
jgi:asparagine synthetase B (glutamine-hydrolysing)